MEERDEIIDEIRKDINLNRQTRVTLKDILDTKQGQARLANFIKITGIATRQWLQRQKSTPQ